jgi:Tfp pilus assembly protein PilO
MTLAQFSRRIFDERKRILLPLLTALVINVGALVLAVLPLRTAVAAAESEATQATLQLGEARRQERAAQEARTSKDTADKELRRFYTEVLPRDLPTAQKTINLWVMEAARDAGLDFEGSQFEWGEVRESALSKASSRITLQGSYASIRRFLHSVEVAQEFVVVESVGLVQQSDQLLPAEGLEVSLIVSTYFLTKPTA